MNTLDRLPNRFLGLPVSKSSTTRGTACADPDKTSIPTNAKPHFLNIAFLLKSLRSVSSGLMSFQHQIVHVNRPFSFSPRQDGPFKAESQRGQLLQVDQKGIQGNLRLLPFRGQLARRQVLADRL